MSLRESLARRTWTRARLRLGLGGFGVAVVLLACAWFALREDAARPWRAGSVEGDSRRSSKNGEAVLVAPVRASEARRSVFGEGDANELAAPGVAPPAPPGDDAVKEVPAPWLVSGWILDAADAPVVGARVQIQHRYTDATQEDTPWRMASPRFRTAADGSFAVPVLEAELPPAFDGTLALQLRLYVHAIRYLDAERPFAPGARGVRVTLRASGSLAVRWAHEHGEVSPGVILNVTSASGVKVERELSTLASLKRPSVFRDLPEGVVTLKVSTVGDRAELVSLTGLRIPAGGRCQDPRLDPLDLTARLGAYRVRVLDCDGHPVESPSVFVFGAGTGECAPRPLASRVDGGDVVVVASALTPPLVVVFNAAGYPSEPGRLSEGSVVTLAPQYRVAVVLARVPALGPLEHHVVEVESFDRTTRVDGATFDFDRGRYRAVLQRSRPGRARARLVRMSFGAVDGGRPLEHGPWVEFTIPDALTSELLLDLRL